MILWLTPNFFHKLLFSTSYFQQHLKTIKFIVHDTIFKTAMLEQRCINSKQWRNYLATENRRCKSWHVTSP